jgi:hypothetical protein
MNRFATCTAKGILLFLALFAAQSSHAAESSKGSSSGKIVKWVDEKGVTHYGDSIPAQYSGKDNTVINSRGIVIERNHAAPPPQVVIEKEKNKEQDRRDRALLASYTTAEEIDLARDRNLQMDEILLTGLRQRKESVQKRQDGYQQRADNLKKANRPIPGELAQDLKGSKDEVAGIDEQINQKQLDMQATRARFEKEKERFILLKEKANSTQAVD